MQGATEPSGRSWPRMIAVPFARQHGGKRSSWEVSAICVASSTAPTHA